MIQLRKRMIAGDSKIVRNMVLHIAEFFRYMSDNEEQRLYYVVPVQRSSPYAYQHSTIRDVATIGDILDLIQFSKELEMALQPGSVSLFESVIGNTLQAYQSLYQRDELPDFPDGNIGDLGFFLLALVKCRDILPAQLPKQWEETKNRIIEILLNRQRDDGSIRIFFDNSLQADERSAEAFYLPEALIGLISSIGSNPKELDERVISRVRKAISYCCQDNIRESQLMSDSATFYVNWQLQLLYHWVHKMKRIAEDSLVANQLEKLIDALKASRIAREPFGSRDAAVEVACYFEGFVHARHAFKMLKPPATIHEDWLAHEIDRSLQFLYDIQMKNLGAIHGGFVHSLYSHEARIDVAGHVFRGLCLCLA